eukprot:scaffold149409_cov27-Tisochrysis_lutea.AAC.3
MAAAMSGLPFASFWGRWRVYCGEPWNGRDAPQFNASSRTKLSGWSGAPHFNAACDTSIFGQPGALFFDTACDKSILGQPGHQPRHQCVFSYVRGLVDERKKCMPHVCVLVGRWVGGLSGVYAR